MTAKALATIAIIVTLGGCAGSRAWIMSNDQHRDVILENRRFSVSQDGDGGYWAIERDQDILLINNNVARRKLLLIQAIESISSCRVTESTLDPAGDILRATVDCK
jgi:hypothetical protein